MTDELLTIHDVARELRVCERTVQRAIDTGGLPVIEIPGRGTRPIPRIRRGDLDAWLQQRTTRRHGTPASAVTPIIAAAAAGARRHGRRPRGQLVVTSDMGRETA